MAAQAVGNRGGKRVWTMSRWQPAGFVAGFAGLGVVRQLGSHVIGSLSVLACYWPRPTGHPGGAAATVLTSAAQTAPWTQLGGLPLGHWSTPAAVSTMRQRAPARAYAIPPAHRPPDKHDRFARCVGVVPAAVGVLWQSGLRTRPHWADPTASRGCRLAFEKPSPVTALTQELRFATTMTGGVSPRSGWPAATRGDHLPLAQAFTMAQAGGFPTNTTHQRVSRFPAALRSTNRPRHGRRRRIILSGTSAAASTRPLRFIPESPGLTYGSATSGSILGP